MPWHIVSFVAHQKMPFFACLNVVRVNQRKERSWQLCSTNSIWVLRPFAGTTIGDHFGMVCDVRGFIEKEDIKCYDSI